MQEAFSLGVEYSLKAWAFGLGAGLISGIAYFVITAALNAIRLIRGLPE